MQETMGGETRSKDVQQIDGMEKQVEVRGRKRGVLLS